MDTDVAKLLPASAKITVDSLRIEPTFVELRIRGSSASACCTCCGTRSTRGHGRCERIIRDRPWRGTPVRIRFIALRFFCDYADCDRKLFAEQIDELVERRGRATRRFDVQLVHLGLEAGGAPGARLARKQGTITSGSTILRRLRGMAATTAGGTLATIGIDEFAFRRGSTYGTIVVDHSTGRPVDILPARDASLVAGWLSMHPTVQYVTRDRAGCYESATSASLPDAVQIADRWHLLANARAALAHLLTRLQPTIRAVAGELSQPIPAVGAVPAPASTMQAAPVLDEPGIAEPVVVASSARLTKEQQLSHDRRLRRVARYERVLELDRQGLSRRAICRMLNMSQKTVASKLAAGQFVERARPVTRSMIDPYVKRVRDWWNEGDHDARSLHRRVTALGFKGSYCIVRRLVSAWRTPEERERISGPKVANPKSVRYRPPLPSGNHLSWLLIDEEIERTEAESKLIELILERVPAIGLARDAVLTFNAAIRERDKPKLEAWASTSRIDEMPNEIRAFAKGIARDWSSVAAAVEQPYSNGRTEGHVNRLKLIKRKMYGRANFDLLRIRVLANTS